MLLFNVLAGLLAVYHVQAQSFLSAISAYPQLSQFSKLLSSNPTLATSLLSTSATEPKTLLVPNDNAFNNYESNFGITISKTAPTLLQQILEYHTLNGTYKADDFSPDNGVTIPTLLTGQQYNNRSAGAALSSASAGDKNGQVVFVSPQGDGKTFRVRQLSSDAAKVQSGLGAQVNLTTTDDGVWDGGRFHIVDGFLTLPQNCTSTITKRSLNSLSASLQRTGLAPVLDTLSNVTCLGPNDAAFLSAGSPDTKLDPKNLTGALLFHTIPQPLYSNFLQTGQTFTTASNATVRVTKVGGEIFFNDAKVLQANVLTNNGLIHVLDRIMSSLDAENYQSPDNSTTTKSATSSSTSSTATSNPTATRSGATTTASTGAASSFRETNPVFSIVLQLGAALVGGFMV